MGGFGLGHNMSATCSKWKQVNKKKTNNLNYEIILIFLLILNKVELPYKEKILYIIFAVKKIKNISLLKPLQNTFFYL